MKLTLVFVLAFSGLALRRRPAVHKRLMVFATLMFTVAAADRVASLVGLDKVRLSSMVRRCYVAPSPAAQTEYALRSSRSPAVPGRVPRIRSQMPMPNEVSPTARAAEPELPPGSEHPRGTLAIVIIFGLLFALGWFAMYFLRFMSADVPHH